MINGISGYGGCMSYWQTQSMPQTRGPEEMFGRIDSDASGGISHTEFETFAEKIAGDTLDTEEALATYDADGDGELSQEEMMNFMAASGIQAQMQPGRGGPGPAAIFDAADEDASGGISQAELETLAEKISGATGTVIDTEEAVSAYDTDGDGELSSEELAAFLEASGIESPRAEPLGMATGGMPGGPSPRESALNAYQMSWGSPLSAGMPETLFAEGGRRFMYNPVDLLA